MKFLKLQHDPLLTLLLTICLLLISVVRSPAATPTNGKSSSGRLEKSDANGFTIPSVTRLLSQNYSHTGTGNSATIAYVVSANERYVAFSSSASNLITNDLNGTWTDIFRLDRETGHLDLVTANLAGTGSANYPSYEPLISADGRYIAFMSAASDLVSNTGGPGVYIRDMESGITQAVSVNPQGAIYGGHAVGLSADGRYVAFMSTATDMVPGLPTDGKNNVFVRDTWGNETRLVSGNRFGSGGGNGDSGDTGNSIPSVRISPDGRFIAFLSRATNLVKDDAYPGLNLFVRDLALGRTSLVSGRYPGGRFLAGASDLVISASGRYIAYSAVPAYLTQVSNCYRSIIIYDIQTESNTLVSGGANGAECSNNMSSEPAISADGRFVAFKSFATDLVPAVDTNNFYDVYVRDRQLGSTTLVSINRWGTNGGNSNSSAPSISADGRYVSFTTFGTDLTTTLDKNQQQDVVLRDLQNGISTLASSAGPGNAGNGASLQSWVSSNGGFVVFNSAASDLGGIDENGALDLYLYENGGTSRSENRLR